jgi:hypothetical protein
MSNVTIAEPLPHFRTAFIDLRARQCRFIVSDEVRDAICCGAPTTETSSWCAHHRRVVFHDRHDREQRKAA